MKPAIFGTRIATLNCLHETLDQHLFIVVVHLNRCRGRDDKRGRERERKRACVCVIPACSLHSWGSAQTRLLHTQSGRLVASQYIVSPTHTHIHAHAHAHTCLPACTHTHPHPHTHTHTHL